MHEKACLLIERSYSKSIDHKLFEKIKDVKYLNQEVHNTPMVKVAEGIQMSISSFSESISMSLECV